MRTLRLTLALSLALVVFLGLTTGPSHSGVSLSRPNIVPETTDTCPALTTPPQLEFCGPGTGGQAQGPNGSRMHITYTGIGGGTQIYLIRSDLIQQPIRRIIRNCTEPECLQLVANTQNGTHEYYTPKAVVIHSLDLHIPDYSLVANIPRQSPVVSTSTFQFLTMNAPCLELLTAAPATETDHLCSQTANQGAILAGYNFMPSETAAINLQCESEPCPTTPPIPIDSSGSFHLDLSQLQPPGSIITLITVDSGTFSDGSPIWQATIYPAPPVSSTPTPAPTKKPAPIPPTATPPTKHQTTQSNNGNYESALRLLAIVSLILSTLLLAIYRLFISGRPAKR